LGDQGHYEQANQFFQESLEMARTLGSPWNIHNVLIEWGGIHLKYRQFSAAATAFTEVLSGELAGESEPTMSAMACYGLARIAAFEGDNAQARRLGQESLAQFAAVGHNRAREVADWLQSLAPDQPTAQ
jgi:hypothetical protein